jgi:Fe-S cluster biosynthesis and repair protein YggX
MARMVKCAKLGRELPGLDDTPFDGPLGQRIYDTISAEAWRMWGEHCKMVINELRLNPARPEAQEIIVKQLEAFLFGEGAKLPEGYVPPQ